MKKLVVFTGAGISAESGLATFRDSNGLWNNHRPEDVADIYAWERDPELVLQFYNERRTQLLTVQPNAAHFALAELEQEYDVTVVTQNVDDLHERGGSTKVVHLHGELMKMCEETDKSVTYPYEQDIKLGMVGSTGHQLRPFIVWFGEDVPLILEAQRIIKDADAFVCVGTSLNVYPAANLVNVPRIGVPRILVNKERPGGMSLGWEQSTHPAFSDWKMLIEPATTGVPKLKEILNELLGK